MARQRPGVVYFVLDETSRLVKIGFTTGNPLRRMSCGQGFNPNPLRLLGVLKAASFRTERDLHARFAHLRRVREWFEFNHELASFVVDNCHPAALRSPRWNYCRVCGLRRRNDCAIPCRFCSSPVVDGAPSAFVSATPSTRPTGEA